MTSAVDYTPITFSEIWIVFLLLFSIFSFAALTYFVCFIRIGNRRLGPPQINNCVSAPVLEHRSGATAVSASAGQFEINHETGLFQQWYTDQPCQRLFGMSFSATMTPCGRRALCDEKHFRSALARLVQHHPVLTTSIRRDSSGQASLRLWLPEGKCEDTTECGGPDDTNVTLQHPGGRPYPLEYVPRVSEDCWQSVLQRLTHTDMDEAEDWLFRVAVLTDPPGGDNSAGCDGDKVDIVLVVHHVIADGLSASNLLADLLTFAAGKGSEAGVEAAATLPVLEPLVAVRPCVYTVLDGSVDLRPPLMTVLRVVGADLLSLPPNTRTFYQGPGSSSSAVTSASTATGVSGTSGHSHMASFSLPPARMRALLAAARARGVTLQGLLGATFMQAAAVIAAEEEDEDEEDVEDIKLFYPLGHAVRRLASVSADAVGVFIASSEYSAPRDTLADSGSDEAALWTLANSLSKHAKSDFRPSLDMLGLLDFLPRESFTPWFLKQGNTFRQGRNSSVELSNLGGSTAVDALLRENAAVQALFVPPAMAPPRLFFCMGRNYLGPVFGGGVVTCCDTLTLTITCNIMQCGCNTATSTASTDADADADADVGVNGLSAGPYASMGSEKGGKAKGKGKRTETHNNDTIACACGCPKEGILCRFTRIVLNKLLKASEK